jgi:hypothetical protein
VRDHILRSIAQSDPRHQGCYDGCRDSGNEGRQTERAQQDLKDKGRPAKRDVVDGGETRACATGDRDPANLGRQAGAIGKPPCKSGACFARRDLAAERRAESDRNDLEQRMAVAMTGIRGSSALTAFLMLTRGDRTDERPTRRLLLQGRKSQASVLSASEKKR